jgi:predicted O-linked N-acetylglucosamine transferase (SPINDLY family)
MTASPTLSKVLALWRSGDRTRAIAAAAELRARNPTNGDALALHAAIALDGGDTATARRCLDDAALMTGGAKAHFNLGNVAFRLGDMRRAIDCFQRSVALDPHSVETQNNLGRALLAAGRADDAARALRRAIELKPGDNFAAINLGRALSRLGQHAEAVRCCLTAVNSCTMDADARTVLGNALLAAGDPAAAIEHLAVAAQLRPNDPDAHYNLGSALLAQGQLHGAATSLGVARRLRPDHVPTLINLGAAERRTGCHADSRETLRLAVSLEPRNATAHLNFGNTLTEMGLAEEARAEFETSITLDPCLAEAHYGLSNAFRRLQRLPEALRSSDSACSLAPDEPRYVSNELLLRSELWETAEAHHCLARLRARWGAGQPIPAGVMLNFSDSPAEQRQAAAAQAAQFAPLSAAPLRGTSGSNRVRATPRGPVRVAYVSPDLGEHPVGSSIVELFERHDALRIEVTLVSLVAHPESSVRSRIKAACSRFVEVGRRSTPEIVDLLRSLDIDVAVDLAGYTERARPALFASRFAPVQAAYLGFPGTLGAPWLDYIIADKFVIPPEESGNFSEHIAWLPECFFPSDTRSEVRPAARLRAAEGLPEDGIVYCCFNGPSRISVDMADAWMHTLCGVPGSVLWLKGANPSAQANLRAFAASRGVDRERLVFAANAPTRDAHLARHALADLYLDTFPYNAHSTARDALVSGLPVLTRAGRTFASRVAGSLLSAVGMEELICASDDAYRLKARQLGNQPEHLGDLRRSIRDRLPGSPLRDMSRLARHLEDAYEIMVHRCRRALPPDHIHVTPRP